MGGGLASEQPAAEASFAALAAGGKTVWIVRHAESENNVSKRTFVSTFGSGKLPASSGEWAAVASLLLLRMDTPLSARGLRQAEAQRRKLDRDDFLASSGVEVVLHSPLERARDTCQTLFEGHCTLIEEYGELYERSISEHLVQSRLGPRVARFTDHLRQRPEQRIVAVGHADFFEELCGAQLGNASVWQATLTPDGQWRDVKLQFETPDVPDEQHSASASH